MLGDYRNAQELELLVTTTRSGSRGDSSQATSCGLIGSADTNGSLMLPAASMPGMLMSVIRISIRRSLESFSKASVHSPQ